MRLGNVQLIKVLAAIFLLSILLSGAANADPVTRLSYQGRLTDGTGVPLADGNYDLTFKIYDALSGGTLLWTEIHNGANQVAVSDGLFSTILGGITALPDFSGAAYYIETTVGETVYAPRQKMGYSICFGNARYIDSYADNDYGDIRFIEFDGAVIHVSYGSKGTFNGLCSKKRVSTNSGATKFRTNECRLNIFGKTVWDAVEPMTVEVD